MCRLAAYLGPPIPLRKFLLAPAHSLVVQSYAPREMQGALLNADGFGVGWRDAEGHPALYRNPMPIWSDPNLDGLGRSLASGLWLANVRSATPGQGHGHANTQPFAGDGLMFMHNGYVRDFSDDVRPRLHRHLRPDIQAGIGGHTDSEFIFALIRQHRSASPAVSLASVLRAALEDLANLVGDGVALCTVVLCDGHSLVAARHAVNGLCPSLYLHAGEPAFPGGRLLASETLSDDPGWQSLPAHSLVGLESGQPPEIAEL